MAKLLSDEEVFGSGRLLTDEEVFGGGRVPKTTQPAKRNAAAEIVANTGQWLGEGVNNILGAGFDLAAPEGDVAAFFRDNAAWWRKQQTAELQARIAAADQRISAAGGDGVWPQVKATAGEYVDDPVLAARLAVTNLPSVIPGLAAGRAAQLLAAGTKAATAVGVGTAAATNAAMNAGSARGEAFEDIKRSLLAKGMPEADATELALQGSVMPAAVGAATGVVSGGTGLEKALLGKAATGAAVRQAGKAFGTEMAGEQLEEVLPQVATNLAAQQVDPTRQLTKDVGRTIVDTAAGAGPTSAVAGVAAGVRARAGGPAPATPSATDPIPADQLFGDLVPAAPADAAPGAPRETLAPTGVTNTPVPGTPSTLPETGTAPRESIAPKSETADTLPRTAGAATSFTTETGNRLDAQYALVEANDLVTSHEPMGLRRDERYPKELQPRDRERAASELQIQGISQRLDPARLGLSADAATGAPIVGADGLVESGNARTIALKRVYAVPGQRAHEYRTWLADNATQFGLLPEQVRGMDKPVLVRVRSTPVDRAEFARQANASTVAAMSPSEQAKADANRIEGMDDLRPDDNGDFATSRDFIRRFVGKLPMTEQAGLIDAGGQLSSAGYARVRNAVLAKAYGDSPVLTRMVESMNDDQRNVSRALMIAAPRVAQMRAAIADGRRFDADITPHLLDAVTELVRLRDTGTSVDDALAQLGIEGDQYSPETRELLRFLADNTRRPRRMADFIAAYFEALDAVGDPAQTGLFGDEPAPGVLDLIEGAKRAVQGEASATESAQQGRQRGAGAPEAGGDKAGQQPGPAESRSGGAEVAAGAAAALAPGWVAFGPETGTLGIPRRDMPQVQAQHRGALTNFINARGIAHERVELAPDNLKPTQAEYSPARVKEAAEFEGGDRSILVSGDGHVLDGHHQWLAALAKGEPVQAVRFDAPVQDLLRLAHQFPSSTSVATDRPQQRDAQAPVQAEEQAAEQTTTVAREEAKVYSVRQPASNPDIPLDLFPDTLDTLQALPAAPGSDRSARPVGAGVRGNVRPAAAVQGGDGAAVKPNVLAVRQDPTLPGLYHLSTQLVVVGRRELPVERVTNWQEAASALRALQRFSVEHFDALITDAAGKPLAVVGAFKGALAQASVYPATLLQEALRIKGAARAWGVHNHPSGSETLSGLDKALARTLHRAFAPSSIEFEGVAAVGSMRFEAVDQHGGVESGALLEGGTKATVPIVERVIQTRGQTVERVDSQARAAQLVSAIAGDKTGVVFLDSQNRLTAWVPMAQEQMAKLRADGTFDRLINSAAEAGAMSAILVDPKAAMPTATLDNMASALASAEVSVLDAIVGGKSLAQTGWSPNIGRTVLSRPRRDQTALRRGADGIGMKVADVQALADRAAAKLPGMPPVVVLASPADLATDGAQGIARGDIEAQGAMGDAEGALSGGTIYLFADRLRDLEHAEHVLLEHEVGHFGLRAMLGAQLSPTLRRIFNENPRVRAAAAALMERDDNLTAMQAIEEALVDTPTAELMRLKGWRELVAKVVKWLAAHGFERLGAKLATWLRGTLSEQQQADLYVGNLMRQARGVVRRRRAGQPDVEPSEPGSGTRLSRASTSTSSPQPRPTAAERADAIIGKKAATPKPLDAVAKAITKVTGIERAASVLGRQGSSLIDRLTPERVKAGLVSDYGVPEAVIDQRAMMQGRQRRQLRDAGALLEKLTTLTRAESRVAYEWMNNEDPRRADLMLVDLPPESVAVLREVRELIDKLSRRAVELGQLTSEQYERHRFAYLRRTYRQYAAELNPGEKARTQRTISILGDQYKGRGMFEAVPMSRIKSLAPEWWKRKSAAGQADTSLKGEKFERLERRALTGAGTAPLEGMEGRAPGRILEVNYWPADQLKPAKYADWDSAGIWEVRDTKGGDLVMWRDFTKAERERMGEIDEARYAIAKTLQRMIHDVEVGNYLEWLAREHAKPEAPKDATVVEASDRYRDTFTTAEWVQVPDSKIPGTSVLRYGKLAGQYLPGPIWNDLRQTVNGQRIGPEWWQKLLSAWKVSKTALSPAVHTNNIMSNVVMADWHDVSAGHVAKAMRILLASSDREAIARAGMPDREAAREVLNRYTDSGGAIGGWATEEVRRDQMRPIVEALLAEEEKADAAAGGTEIGVYSALQHLMHARFKDAFAALKDSKPGKATRAGANAMIDAYQAEDEVFRLAAWLQAKEQGKSDADAGKVARKSFLDYHINAPWVAAARATAFPFISYTYRAVPMLLDIAANKPHKLLKLMAVAGALNYLGVMIGGGGDDEERKLLPEERAGKVWGLVPKLIRMPWNDEHGSPVYLDIRRWIPVGDVVDIGQGHAALPLLPAMYPGGPLALIGEIILNRSTFTGKPITLETDTAGEKAAKLGDYLWKAFAPNLLGVPGTYATTGVADAAAGRTDKFGREQSVPQALASAVGVKVGSYPADVLRINLRAKANAEVAEIDRVIAGLERQRQTHQLDAAEFLVKAQAQQEKKKKVLKELAEKVN